MLYSLIIHVYVQCIALLQFVHTCVRGTHTCSSQELKRSRVQEFKSSRVQSLVVTLLYREGVMGRGYGRGLGEVVKQFGTWEEY